jgi:hypothetical protein
MTLGGRGVGVDNDDGGRGDDDIDDATTLELLCAYRAENDVDATDPPDGVLALPLRRFDLKDDEAAAADLPGDDILGLGGGETRRSAVPGVRVGSLTASGAGSTTEAGLVGGSD